MLYVYKNRVYFCILNMYALKIRSTTWNIYDLVKKKSKESNDIP